MKSIDYYAGLVQECVKNDQPKMDLYAKIDMHRKGQWQPSAALSSLPWIKGHNFSATAPADALDAGSRTFASRMPKVTIDPLSEEITEYERVERQETALEWHFKRMNMRGKKTTHWQIMESAMRYCAVAFETEYLPFAMKGREKDRRLKAMLRQSSFNWTIHHPGTVHPRFSKYGMESVCLVKVVNFQEMIDEYGEDNPGIKDCIAKVFRGNKPKFDRALTTFFTFCKTTTWEETCIYLAENGNSQNVSYEQMQGTKDKYVLLHEEHELEFIPWVYCDNEDPILKNAINTGLLDNLNNLRLISFSSAVALAAASQQLIKTPDGTLRNVHIDNKNPTQPMVTDLTTQVQDLAQPRPSDAIEAKVAQATGEVYTSTVAQILADANKLAGTENFSTANLAFQIAMGNLSLARDVAERAEEEGFFQMYQWIDHAGDKPLVAFREKSKVVGEKEVSAGEELVISKGDFDTRYLYIDVQFREYSQLDEQAKWNMAITQVERLGFSRHITAEEHGVENYHLHEQKRAVEDLFLAKIAAETAKIAAEAEAYSVRLVGQAQAEVQAAMQPQPPAGAEGAPPPANPAEQVAGMNQSNPMAQGADMRAGGMAAAQSQPFETRETIQGEAGGVQLA